MSVSKWRYTEECNGRPCPGDCDHCSFEPADLISRADAIEAVKGTILKRFNLADWYEELLNCGVEIEDRIKALPSADAVHTCNTCADKALCIMSAPDGNWRACKDYRPSADRPIIEHDREWIIGCIKHDGFIKTDRFDKANQIILEALSAEQNCDNCKEYGSYKCTKCDGEMYYKTEPSDLISRADAIEAVDNIKSTDNWQGAVIALLSALPSADAVSRKEYEETDGVITIEKQSAKDVGEIKHIVIRSPNYTRYFYNESMPTSAEAVQEWIPVSERLPNESGEYLCTIPLDADETYTEVLTFHKGRFYEDDDEWGATYHDDVLAWMPLPKPHREEGDMCKYKDECGYDFQYKISTDNMNTLSDALLRSKCEVDAKLADAVQGEWKCMGDCGVTECDQCGWSIEEYVGDYNYCPNCGAKMKGGDDE